MNILLIGSEGREHALAKALRESPSCATLHATPGNPGILALAQRADVDAADFAAVSAFCRERAIDLVVIGPDQALADGMADALRADGVCVFGPDRAAARIEWSKSYSKELMKRAGIPTAAYQTFTADREDEAMAYARSRALPVVVKADGLALGKGVIVAQTHDEACAAIGGMFAGAFKEAGSTVVVEDFLHGEEASVFAICDGKDFVTLAPAQDHKRALDDDQGKNTGGMGSFAPARIVSREVMIRVEERIIRPLLRELREQGSPFIGCLFVGLMIDGAQPSVVEFNARFGDPETQSVLAVFRGDFARLLHSAASGAVDAAAVEETGHGVACTVILASEGYPDAYEKGFRIDGMDDAATIATVFHAGTAQTGSEIRTNGGRVLGVTAVATSLREAREAAYAAAGRISFENKFMRSDIGRKGLTYEK
ncbi:MAG: phosphoribosylamine--glycine ligase [Candidatus Kapaibacterium sp.]